MNNLPGKCPICSGEILVSKIQCLECDTSIEGRFEGRVFSALNPDQLDFVETFVRCEGKINRMEGELGLSYPTIRNRLHEVIKALGYEPGSTEDIEDLSDKDRVSILEQLDQGIISTDEAMVMLQEAGG